MIRRPPRSTLDRSSAASDVYKRQIWAKHWYTNVHNSTGFQTYQEETIDLPDHLNPIYLEAKVYYDALIRHAIKI